ncbi:MAG: HzsA-related protein [Planctomycetota bacterium]
MIQALLTGGALTVGAGAAERLVFTQIPIESGFDLPAGSRIVSFDPSRPQDGVTNLTRGFSAAARPDVSFDGQRLLFVGRQTSDEPFAVWEMNVDGSGSRRITNQAAGIREAIYLSTIYTIDDAEPTDQIAYCGEDAGGTRVLYTCRMDGTRAAQITFDPHGATDPCALSDGRLLFSGGPGSALLTVNTDGTDVFVFAAAHEPAAFRGMACETDEGWVVYVESPNDDEDRGGALVAVSRTSSLHTRRVIDDGVSGRYRSPAPAGAGRLLVSFRRPESRSYDLSWVDFGIGKRSGVFNSPQWHELDAMMVRPRVRPAGRSSVVDERVSRGLLYCLDAYLSDTAQSQVASEQRIERLSVYRAFAGKSREAHGQDAGAIDQELLGTVPVEADGSIHLGVPVRTPLRLETLGPDGEVLQAMRSWFWVMPGERRGCIGCHEDRELSPPNRHPLALRKPPHPVGVAQDPAGETK